MEGQVFYLYTCSSFFIYLPLLKNNIMENLKTFVIVLLSVLVLVFYTTSHTMERKYSVAMENIKAYDSELASSKNHVAAYKLTVEQLSYFQDSILREMDNIRKELKVKDKNLHSITYISSQATKVDTVNFIDTVFVENLKVDTLLKDKWYELKLSLSYPSTIVTKPSFKSEKYIVVSEKKETVGPPKKFFLFRWFQKKYKILHIDVVEKNPYISEGNGKYIEIVK